MRTGVFRLLTAAFFTLALTGCTAQGLVGQLPQEVRSRMPRFDNGPSVLAPAGSDQAAIQDVILRGNHEQEQAIASKDESVMRDTATDSHYQEMARMNQDMLAHGITSITLANLDWGDITLNDDGTATATTWETWLTEFADGGTDQSRDRNVYSLVQQDGAWKIKADDHPDDVLSSPVGVRPTTPPNPAPQVPPAPSSSQGRGISANWAGYAATHGTFTSVAGTWTVPQPAMDGTTGADATWVGIGGEHSRDLIQAGTEAAVSSGNRVRYYAWIEMLPDYARPISIGVHPGDSVTVSLAQQDPGSWLISFKNNTTGASYNRTVQYQSSLSSAEWIEEAPSSGRGSVLPLDNFGSVTFSNAWTTKDGQTVNLAQAGATPITMSSGRGRTLVVPSPITDDGAGFTATRTDSNPVPVPSTVLQRTRRALGF